MSASQPPYGAPGYPVRRWNGLAIASFVLSLFWLFGIGSLLAVIFGVVALGQIRKAGGWQRGRGLAIAGLAIGICTLLFLIFAIVVSAAHGGGAPVHHSNSFTP